MQGVGLEFSIRLAVEQPHIGIAMYTIHGLARCRGQFVHRPRPGHDRHATSGAIALTFCRGHDLTEHGPFRRLPGSTTLRRPPPERPGSAVHQR